MAKSEAEQDLAAATAESERQLARALWDDPETGPVMRRLTKQKFPNAHIPEVDLEARGNKILADVRAENDALRKEITTDRVSRDLEGRRKRITDGFTTPDGTFVQVRPEDVPAIEKIMQDELIGSHEAAARYWLAQQQVAAPSASMMLEVPGLRGAGGDEFKGIVEDREAWARKQAYQIHDDFAKGRGNKWL